MIISVDKILNYYKSFNKRPCKGQHTKNIKQKRFNKNYFILYYIILKTKITNVVTVDVMLLNDINVELFIPQFANP